MDSPAPAALPCRDSTRMGRILSGIEPRLTTARRLLRDPDAAADVVQSAFEKVLRYCEQFRDGARPSTGMHRIVVNEAFMWLRRETWHAPPLLTPMGPAPFGELAVEFRRPRRLVDEVVLVAGDAEPLGGVDVDRSHAVARDLHRGRLWRNDPGVPGSRDELVLDTSISR